MRGLRELSWRDHGLGPMTMRTSSEAASEFIPLKTSPPTNENRRASSNRLEATPPVTTVIPEVLPPAACVNGNIDSGMKEGSVGIGSDVTCCQPAALSRPDNWAATLAPSGASLKNRIFTGTGVIPPTTARNGSDRIIRGLLNSSSLSSACLVRTVASAIFALALAISAWAVLPTASAAEIFSPASTLYRSNSALDSEISSLWSRTTQKAATPTTSEITPASASDTTTRFSQAWSDRPNIRLNLLELFALSSTAVSCIGLLGVALLAIGNFWRDDQVWVSNGDTHKNSQKIRGCPRAGAHSVETKSTPKCPIYKANFDIGRTLADVAEQGRKVCPS